MSVTTIKKETCLPPPYAGVLLKALILPVLATLAGLLLPLPAWLWMWMIAFALWAGFKFAAFARAGGRSAVDSAFFLWPGMDPRPFARLRSGVGVPVRLSSAAFGFAGGGLLLLAAVNLAGAPLVAGALGFTSIILLLHFGLFVVLASGWRRLGYPVDPIMQAPWRSRSLLEFWSRRWNRGFSDWTRDFLFGPLSRHCGPRRGLLGGFLLSGLLHEWVISVPAQAGFGGPTLYFLLQGLSALRERHRAHPRGKWSRLRCAAVILLPLPLLFHPPFLREVIHPMLAFAP